MSKEYFLVNQKKWPEAYRYRKIGIPRNDLMWTENPPLSFQATRLLKEDLPRILDNAYSELETKMRLLNEGAQDEVIEYLRDIVDGYFATIVISVGHGLDLVKMKEI